MIGYSVAYCYFISIIIVYGLDNKVCDIVPGSKFVRTGKEDSLRGTADQVEALTTKLDENYKLKRWDGVLGSVYEHGEWMLKNIKNLSDESAPGFRHYGENKNIVYEIHDELTQLSNGDGLFRLSGKIDIPPQLLVAMVMDADSLGRLDETVMYMNFVHRYPDGRTYLCIWNAAPGFPFHWRDGLDISAWTKDEETGTYWQYALSVPEEMPEISSMAMRAVDKYWGYKLRPSDDGKSTYLTLVCQTSLYGYIPKMAVNWKIGEVLSDYVRKAEDTGKQLLQSGKAEELISRILL